MASDEQYPLRQFSTGECLFKENDIIKGLFIVKSGEVTCVKKGAADRLIPVGNIKGNGVLGEETILTESRKANYSAVALSDVTAIEIPAKDIEKVLSESSPWVKNILFDMSDKISKTTQAMAEHRIVDARFNGNKDFSSEEESLISNALD